MSSWFKKGTQDNRRAEAITWFNGILTYIIIWWVVLFAVLPWWVKVPENPEKGHANSAPERPMLWRKVAITTLVAGLVWLGVHALVVSGLISIRPN